MMLDESFVSVCYKLAVSRRLSTYLLVRELSLTEKCQIPARTHIVAVNVRNKVANQL